MPLGFQMAPACGQMARLAETSSWPFQKPDLVLRAGVLDPDYRGQVAAIFTNIGNQDYVYVDKGERVAQVIFSCFRCAPWQPIAAASLCLVRQCPGAAMSHGPSGFMVGWAQVLLS